MMSKFGSRITFLTIYIMEAHASDTWPMGFDVCYPQTKTVSERCAVARDFIKDNNYEFPIRIDPPPLDAFNSLFAAWPLRFYIINADSTIHWIAEPFGDLMLVDFLSHQLQTLFASKSEKSFHNRSDDLNRQFVPNFEWNSSSLV